MIKSVVLSLAFLLAFPVLAQEKTLPPQFVFPEFSPGVVGMKNGTPIRALLNYNMLSEEMVFFEAGAVKAILQEQLKDIDTVYIKDRKFFMLQGTFVELLQQNPYGLYVQYNCRVKPPDRATAFGKSSQTSSNITYSPKLPVGAVYNVDLNGAKILRETSYWSQKGGKLQQAKNLNQLLKWYGEQKHQGKDYAKQHNLDFDNPQQVLQLVEFLEQGS